MHISPFAYAYYNTAAYKILQRVYKFGGQPVVLDLMTKKFGADFDEKFGHKTGRTLLSATSGSLIGIGEGKKSIVFEDYHYKSCDIPVSNYVHIILLECDDSHSPTT